jgi:hypothetical protein
MRHVPSGRHLISLQLRRTHQLRIHTQDCLLMLRALDVREPDNVGDDRIAGGDSRCAGGR